MTQARTSARAIDLYARRTVDFEERVAQALQVLQDAAKQHPGRAVFTTSLGAEDMVVVELQQPLPLADFSINRVGGALIVVDPVTHRTSGALLVRGV